MSPPPSTQDILVNWIEIQIQSHPDIPILFISGAQGIGKSTAIKYAKKHFQNNIAVLGLDEFYLTRTERLALATKVHPLFEVRGPAGTHDLEFLNTTIDSLLQSASETKTRIPKFLKAIDDRAPEQDWDCFRGRPSAILVEGWCIGAEPDLSSPSSLPINSVEEEDQDGVWRQHQEIELATRYAKLWDRADAFFHICAPNFEQVLSWRVQQEETTLGLSRGALSNERKSWVCGFIQHYERVTKRMLSGHKRGGYNLNVSKDRQPILSSQTRPPVIVFSDLDGTLLDHETYQFDLANEALRVLSETGAALVLASSKTAAEIAGIRSAAGFAHCPAIVENGSGVLEPNQSPEGLDNSAYMNLLDKLEELPAAFRQRFAGFSNWSAEDVATQTGLSISSAKLAKQRCFSEPVKWTGTEDKLREFIALLSEKGISARHGGRFLTLSFGSTKADQMTRITSRFFPAPTIALGDAPNDIEMICSANYGVIVRNSHGMGIDASMIKSSNRIIRTAAEGPRGWNHAILELTKKIGISPTD